MGDDAKDIESWLEQRWMGRFVNTLLEHNFTELPLLKATTNEQRATIIKLFEKPGHRLKMRLLFESLGQASPSSAPVTAPMLVEPDAPIERRKTKYDSEPDSSASSEMEEDVDLDTHMAQAAPQPGAGIITGIGSLPPFPDSDVDSEDSDHEQAAEPVAAATPATATPAAAAATAAASTGPAAVFPAKPSPAPAHGPAPSISQSNSTTSVLSSGSDAGRPRQSSAIRKRQEAFLKSAQQSDVPKPKPAGAVSALGGVHGNDAFKNRAAAMGAALQASMAKGPPPLFMKRPETQYAADGAPAPAQPEPEEEYKPPQPILGGGAAPQPQQSHSHQSHASYSAMPPAATAAHGDYVMDKGGAAVQLLDSGIPLLDEGGDNEDGAGLPPVSALGHPDKTGMLEKRGVELWNQAWKNRFFILKGPNLFWLKKKDDKNVAGMIKLAERGIAFNAPDERSLEIVTRKKAYVLRAESSAEMAEWYNAFKMVQAQAADAPAAKPAPPPGRPQGALSPRSAGYDADDINRLLELVKTGSMFIKYKHKKGQDRMVWCPAAMDRIVWGDGHDKKKIKGFLLFAEMLRVSDGCFGSKRNENAFTILGQERNLELEAPSLSEKNDWVRAITYLIASRRGR